MLFLCSDLPFTEHNAGSGWDFIMGAKIAARLCKEESSLLRPKVGRSSVLLSYSHNNSYMEEDSIFSQFHKKVTKLTKLQIHEDSENQAPTKIGWAGQASIIP